MKKMWVIIGVIVILVLGALAYLMLGVKIFSKDKDTSENKKEVSITLNGDDVTELIVFNEYIELGANAKYGDDDVSSQILVDGNVDVNKPGSYEVSYSISIDNKEAAVKRTVNVIDNVAPVINLKGKSEITIYLDNNFVDPGYEATDNVDGDLTSKVEITGEVDSSKVGEYLITYKVSDSSSNVATQSRKVSVVTKPVVKPEDIVKPTTSGTGLPVLMYHFFYDASKGEKGKDANWMEISDFDAQMKYLADNNFYFPTWEEVAGYVNGTTTLPEKSIVVTIDDGDVSFINYAIPVIEKYNVRATSFAITSWNGEWMAGRFNFPGSHLNVQSHSHDSHRSGANGRGRLVNMTYAEALEDVSKSRDLLGGATVFCYPFGHYNDTAIQALKDANFKLAFTTAGGRVYPGSNPYALPRVRMSRGISLQDFVNKVS